MELYVNPQITGFRQDVDGTIKELKIGSNKEDAWANIAEQSGKKLDNNKTATINVSTYTEPVEILPTSGKDGMKKATVTLSNIPSGGGNFKSVAQFEQSLGWQDYIVFFETETWPESGTTVNVVAAETNFSGEEQKITTYHVYNGPALFSIGDGGCGTQVYILSGEELNEALGGVIYSSYRWTPEP